MDGFGRLSWSALTDRERQGEEKDMNDLKISRYTFEYFAEVTDLEIREDYSDGYQKCIGLVGSESSFREFLIRLAVEGAEDKSLGFKAADIVRLSNRAAINNMGRDAMIFYWGQNFLTLFD